MRIHRNLSAWLASLAMCAALCAAPVHAEVTPKNEAEAVVVGLLDMGFNQKKVAEAFETYVGPYYIQHNPIAPDGKEAAVKFLSGWLPTVPDLHVEIKRIISDGDMVWVHSHVTRGADDRGTAAVNIFRLESGKVVEHWEVSTEVPANPLNDNTMF